jgi:hypothetical protein
MAKVYITEYESLPRDVKGMVVPVPQEPALVEQTPVAIGGASVQSAAFNANTKFVRIHTDAICSIKFGTNPTADANSQRLRADATEFYGVVGGHKVAVITNT